ncbi:MULTISPECIES: aminoglycoside 3'-phosphotransferase [unclassified Isoptericola]|uniref:aminoglycoside 3'-phosphotransferase n=1 Tax=unclassified Isoptericola TaxID=2623355 RepID=UPI002713C128|nr:MULTISPECIES: aminoglycoside 3'-phosphotransferase [unclassified Isoptericola]MDO8145497.1 aminoglycoside 3'-phosphotransferase [Isoptericola sp. 178]MDO8150917.1 aminoglycoside 3'-phosphotransferase [Isoptericola sp. b408]
MSRDLAAPPRGPVVVPDAVAALAGADDVAPVWRNTLGGLTFRLFGGQGERYVKWVPTGTPEIDLDAEAERLVWAGRHTRVPRVLGRGQDATGSWLATAALPGRSAVDPTWLARPETAVRAIGAGLRALHDTLPVADCPFSSSATDRVARLEPAVGADVGPVPPVDRLVVCHGDACAPNTLVADDGTWAGHVDLGTLGVADRWADLATASLSLGWNYGDGYEPLFFAAYDIEPDAERIAFYRRLWDLG